MPTANSLVRASPSRIRFDDAPAMVVRRILTASGFDAVDLAELQEPVRLGADGEDAFGFVSRTGVTRGLLAELDEDARQAALGALREGLAAHATPEGVLVGSSAWLITAHR